MFFVDPNGTDSPRSADVTVTYGEIVRTFTVNQDAGTPAPKAFTLNIKDVGFDHVICDVIPDDKEMTYIANAIHTSYAGWDENDPDAFILDELDWYAFLAGGYDALAGYLSQIAMTGDATDLTVDGLDAETEHILYAFGVSLEGEPLTELCYEYFTTEDVEPSDNQISIEIYDVLDRQASINITTTNTDPYAYGAAIAAPYKNLTDEQIFDILLEMDLSGNVRTGDLTGETFWNLQAGTEYVVFAFGFDAGKPTTELVKTFFTTKELETVDLPLKIIAGPYFDVNEIVEAFSELSDYMKYGLNRALGMINFEPTDNADYLWAIYYEDVTDPTLHPDSKILADIEVFGMSEPYMYNFLNYGQDHTVVGACYDKTGTYGPVARLKINITKDDVSPITEFPADEYFAPAGPKHAPLVIRTTEPAENVNKAAPMFNSVKKGNDRDSFR